MAAPTIWNQLPITIKSFETIAHFCIKKNNDDFCLSTYMIMPNDFVFWTSEFEFSKITSCTTEVLQLLLLKASVESNSSLSMTNKHWNYHLSSVLMMKLICHNERLVQVNSHLGCAKMNFVRRSCLSVDLITRWPLKINMWPAKETIWFIGARLCLSTGWFQLCLGLEWEKSP